TARTATGSARDVDDLQLGSLQRRALGGEVEVEVERLGDHTRKAANRKRDTLHPPFADLLAHRGDHALGDGHLVHGTRLPWPPPTRGGRGHDPNLGGRAPRFMDHVTPPRRPSTISSGPRLR